MFMISYEVRENSMDFQESEADWDKQLTHLGW